MIFNPFQRLYTNDVKIMKITHSGGYSDNGVKSEELCSIKADVQPYNGGLSEREYGLAVECHLRMFCDNNEHLTEGNYAETGGKRYKIIYAAPWGLGAEVLLQEVSAWK